MTEPSTKPYLIRAIHEWCKDNGYTPYLSVAVDERAAVPRDHVKNGEIVLNVGTLATNRVRLGNELIEFQARFNGKVRDIVIPVENVLAIYARETGQGMAFDVAKPAGEIDSAPVGEIEVAPPATAEEKRPRLASVPSAPADAGAPEPPRPGGRPRLTVIK